MANLKTFLNENTDPASVWADMCSGNVDALGALYDIYIDSLYAYGIRLSPEKETVMDAIHDVFLSLHKYHHNLAKTENVQAYLCLSLKREILRKHKAGVIPMYHLDPAIAQSEAMSTTGYEEELIDSERETDTRNLLQRAIEKLTGYQKKAIAMRFEEEMSYEEIAENLHVSPASARTMIYRTLKVLRKGIHFLL